MAWNDKGHVLRLRGKPAQALLAFETGLMLDDAEPLLWRNLGVTLVSTSANTNQQLTPSNKRSRWTRDMR